MTKYRIVLLCHGVPTEEGAAAAVDIEAEFAARRKWHQNVRCTWDGTALRLEAENDCDSNGLALRDELSDCVSAYVRMLFGGRIEIESVRVLSDA